MSSLLNLILFQAGWWSCVFFGNGQISLTLWTTLLCGILVVHLLGTARRIDEIGFHFLCSAIGVLIDSFLLSTQVLQTPSASIPPLWLAGMWALFPMILLHSLSWIEEKPLYLQFLLGGIGGAATYWSGEALGLLSFPSTVSLVIVFLIWGSLLPLFYWMAQKIVRRNTMNIKDRRVYITGSSRGIGKALAEEAARRGAHLVHLVRNPSSITPDDYLALGAKSCDILAIDMLSRESIDSVAQKIREEGKGIDVFINNAGLLTGGLIENQSTDEVYDVVQVNLTGLIHLTKEILPILIRQGHGVVVNNSSVSGRMFFPCASTYAATKAGVVAFNECIKQELAPAGIKTLLLLTPGVKTEMYDKIDDLYGENLKLDFMTSMPAQMWAETVFNAIANGQETLMPGSGSNFGLLLAHHMPKAFQKMVSSSFRR